MTTSFKFLQRNTQQRVSHLPLFWEWLFDATIESKIKKITSLLIKKKNKTKPRREMVWLLSRLKTLVIKMVLSRKDIESKEVMGSKRQIKET